MLPFNQMTFEEIKKWFWDNDRPTNGIMPVALWRWSNSFFVHPKEAIDFMKDCGYVPFSGYPLKKLI